MKKIVTAIALGILVLSGCAESGPPAKEYEVAARIISKEIETDVTYVPMMVGQTTTIMRQEKTDYWFLIDFDDDGKVDNAMPITRSEFNSYAEGDVITWMSENPPELGEF